MRPLRDMRGRVLCIKHSYVLCLANLNCGDIGKLVDVYLVADIGMTQILANFFDISYYEIHLCITDRYDTDGFLSDLVQLTSIASKIRYRLRYTINSPSDIRQKDFIVTSELSCILEKQTSPGSL